ncbi:MAG: phosphodiesterase YaeI [Planctomycetota bacterium]|nr:phosphodiesterase YaeI [Planctomycetota bacterium]
MNESDIKLELTQPKRSRLVTRRRMLACLAATATAVYTDMRFIEPNWIGVGRHRVPILPAGSNPVRIVQLSDLHASSEVPLDFIEYAINLGLQQKPDIICLTGDFITHSWDEWDAYSKIMQQLSAAAPTFASTGNHDGCKWIARYGGYARPTKVVDMLEKANIRVLMNEREQVAIPNKAGFELIGLGDIWADDFKPQLLEETKQVGTPRVLLSHNPDTKDLIEKANWDLMLSGHTHGGQLTLPWGSTPFAPVRDKRFVRGLHPWKNHWLHITKGVGSLRKMRLNWIPEISVVELVSVS